MADSLLEFATQVLSILIENSLDRAEIPAITLEEAVRRMRDSGMSKEAIRERLLNDLDNSGPLFGGFRSQFKSVSEQLIERSAQLAENEVYKNELGPDELFDWVLDERVSNHCEDCLDRATWPAMTWGEWELVGLPGSGVTVCTFKCYCGLAPSAAKQNEPN